MLFRAGLLMVSCVLIACEPIGTGDDSDGETSQPDTPAQAPALTMFDDTVDDLAQATLDAQRTAEEARVQWEGSTAEQRPRWWVKWAAPTVGGGVEHVWLHPDKWTMFRIEGRLTSTPTRALECGRTLGERVSFSVDEMSDWLFVVNEGPPPVHRGGYTIAALDELGATAP